MKLNKRGDIVALDWKFTGTEPSWAEWEDLDFDDFVSRLNSALKFYNYYCDTKDYRKWVCDWMSKNGYSKKEVALIKGAGNSGVPITAGKLCRMISRGMPDLHPKSSLVTTTTRIRNSIDDSLKTLSYDAAEVEVKVSAPVKVKITPYERILRRVNNEIIAELDCLLDDIAELLPKTTPAKIPTVNIASLLRNANIPRNGVKLVITWLQEWIDEFTKARDKTCQDAVDGYGYLSTPQLRRIVLNFENMVTEAMGYAKMKVKTQKPRTPKAKPAEKQVARMKYAASSDEYGLTSLDPSRIPYAQFVCLFNAKTRRLSVYQAKSTAGLTVKGSTIKDYNPDESYVIAIRKPGDVLPAIISGNVKKITKKLATIKTKKYEANGRVNDKTLIVKAID
jgi:hypothetical protein